MLTIVISYSQFFQQFEFALYLWSAVGVVPKPINEHLENKHGASENELIHDQTLWWEKVVECVKANLIRWPVYIYMISVLCYHTVDSPVCDLCTVSVPRTPSVDSWAALTAFSWTLQSLLCMDLSCACLDAWCLWPQSSGMIGRGTLPRWWKARSKPHKHTSLYNIYTCHKWRLHKMHNDHETKIKGLARYIMHAIMCKRRYINWINLCALLYISLGGSSFNTIVNYKERLC